MRKLLTAVTVALLALMPPAASAREQRAELSAIGTSGGAIVVVYHSVRPLPATTTELRRPNAIDGSWFLSLQLTLAQE
jgi:hypothetical protein